MHLAGVARVLDGTRTRGGDGESGQGGDKDDSELGEHFL